MQTTYIYEEIPNVKETLENKSRTIFLRKRKKEKKKERRKFIPLQKDLWFLEKIAWFSQTDETKEYPEEGKGEKKWENKLGGVGVWKERVEEAKIRTWVFERAGVTELIFSNNFRRFKNQPTLKSYIRVVYVLNDAKYST